MKKLLFVFFVFLIIILIYFFTVDKKVYYLSFGKSSYSRYVKDFYRHNIEKYVEDSSNYMVMDIVRKIDDNYKVDNMYIKNILVKADLIILNLNFDNFYERVNDDIYDYVFDFSLDLDILFEKLRFYSKEKIIFIGPFNKGFDSDLIRYFDSRIKNSCKNYDIFYVSNFELDKFDTKKISTKIINLLKA